MGYLDASLVRLPYFAAFLVELVRFALLMFSLLLRILRGCNRGLEKSLKPGIEARIVLAFQRRAFL